MPASQLDAKDAKILGMLKEDSRASTQAIADALGMPRVTVHDRIKRLQERGVVRRFTVELGKEELGWSLHAFILANWAGERGQMTGGGGSGSDSGGDGMPDLGSMMEQMMPMVSQMFGGPPPGGAGQGAPRPAPTQGGGGRTGPGNRAHAFRMTLVAQGKLPQIISENALTPWKDLQPGDGKCPGCMHSAASTLEDQGGVRLIQSFEIFQNKKC